MRLELDATPNFLSRTKHLRSNNEFLPLALKMMNWLELSRIDQNDGNELKK